VFESAEIASFFVSLLAKVKQRDGLVILAWCLMSNHFHIALRAGPIPISRPLRSLQQLTTRRFNARNGFLGRLWQGRYKAKLVNDQRYLDGLLAYIHLNPVTAGLVTDPAEHLWSGHRDIIGRTRRPITDVDEVLMLFGNTRGSARRAYVRSIKGTATEEWAGEVPGRLPWWRVGKAPADDNQPPSPDRSVAFMDELGRSTGPDRPRLDPVDFIGKGADLLGVQLDTLKGRRRGPEIVQAREILATLGVERYSLKVKDIASVLLKSAEAVSRMVSRGADKRQHDDTFSRKFEALDRQLTRINISDQ
jgi:REP element-mobilizing transposase RayT